MIIGCSEAMKQIHRQIETIGQLLQEHISVLIVGETGVGKELVAQAIHEKRNQTKKGHFVSINCSAIRAELLESELFGYVKGAFTGATNDKKGHFHQAKKGTLFLDEIGELPIELQPKFLRVLDEKSLIRVGATEKEITEIHTLLFATNRNLPYEIERGQFRQDLYFRIHQFEIHVPPLRNRKEDIPLLVDYFLGPEEEFSIRLSDSAYELFYHYRWPGNVRELRNVVDRCLTFYHGQEVDQEMLIQAYPLFQELPSSPKCVRAKRSNSLLPCWEQTESHSDPPNLKECISCERFQHHFSQFLMSHPNTSVANYFIGKYEEWLGNSRNQNVAGIIDIDEINYEEWRNIETGKVEKYYLEALIKKHGPNKSLIAKKINLSERQTYRLLKKHGCL